MKKSNVITRITSKFRISRRVFAYPYVIFLLMFVVLPLALVLVRAFMSDVDNSFTLANFAAFFSESSNFKVLGVSLLVGLITTFLCLLIGYPVALFIHRYHRGSMLALLFIVPMWVNFLIRTLAMKYILEALHIEDSMIRVILGMVYNYLPFMILPLYTTISNIDESYIEASRDLGADTMTVFTKTILPLSIPGIISGVTMVFIPTISTYAICEILSEGMITLFGNTIDTKFIKLDAWGVGSVMSLIMLVFVLLSSFVMNKYDKSESKSLL